MPFKWKDIQKNWLYELPVSYSKDEVVRSFNKVEKRFGKEFFEQYDGIRGTYFVTLIVDLNKLLEEEKKGNFRMPYQGEIIKNIENNKIILSDTNIRLAAHFLRHNLLVDSEPVVLVKEKEKRPDLGVKFNKKWIYIEESKYYISDRQKELFTIMDRISEVMDKINQSLNIEVSILKDNINEKEIERLIQDVLNLSNTKCQPQELNVQGISQIITYKKGQEKPIIEEQRPALGMASLRVGRGVECHLNVSIPFTDARISKMVTKSKQLSPKEHNIIILDVSFSGNLKRLSELSKKLLKPDKHRKIGAIIFVQKSLYVKSLNVSVSLITHPNPINPIPMKFIRLIKDHFNQNPEYKYKKLN